MREKDKAAGDNGGRGESGVNPQGSSNSSRYGAHLLPQHAALLAASGISPDVAASRIYRSIETKADLQRKGFSPAQRNVPGLLIPIYNALGEFATYQFRPDEPRISSEGKPIKYETPSGSRMVLDVPLQACAWIGDPKRPLWITEGSRKADAAVSIGLCCVALLGVWNFRGSNEHGGKVVLPDWESIALNGRDVFITFDSDVMTKREVQAALARLKAFLEQRGARVYLVYLPPADGGAKVGLDDYLAKGHDVGDLLALATTELRAPENVDRETTEQEARRALERAGGLLDRPDLLDVIGGAIRGLGYAGSLRPPKLLYLATNSHNLTDDQPVNVLILGPSAAGKTFEVEMMTPLFPPDAIHIVTAASERAWIYSDEDFAHKHIFISETTALHHDGVGASILRSIAWGGKIVYDTVEKGPDGLHGRRIEKAGPTGVITTATKPLEDELSTRFLTQEVQDDADQTRAILESTAARASGARQAPDLRAVLGVQEWLHLAGRGNVVIPYSALLAKLFPAHAVRARRDFTHLMTLIKSHALLYQRQRRREATGAIVANEQDYRAVFDLASDIFRALAADGVSDTVRETVAAVGALHNDGNVVTTARLADHLGLDRTAAYRRAARACDLGFVVNSETRPKKPMRLEPGDPLPDAVPALPNPARLGTSLTAAPRTDYNSATDQEDATGIEASQQVATSVATDGATARATDVSGSSKTSRASAGCMVAAVVGGYTGTCDHRPPGEADRLWDLGEATWADARMCPCCSAPSCSDLSAVDEACRTCRQGQPAPERGAHLVRMALDLGGKIVAGQA